MVIAQEQRLAEWERKTAPLLTVLAFAMLAGLVTAAAWELNSPWLRGLDLFVWAAFVVDYVIRLNLARGFRWKFIRRNPLDLIAIMLPFARILRILANQARLTSVAQRGRTERLLTTTAVLTGTFVTAGAATALQAERYVEGSQITTFPDAMWWAITTVTTVGYGDITPVTAEGRLIAAILMVVGVAAMGVVTASIASKLFQRTSAAEDAEDDAQIAQLQQQVAHLTALVESQSRSRQEDQQHRQLEPEFA